MRRRGRQHLLGRDVEPNEMRSTIATATAAAAATVTTTAADTTTCTTQRFTSTSAIEVALKVDLPRNRAGQEAGPPGDAVAGRHARVQSQPGGAAAPPPGQGQEPAVDGVAGPRRVEGGAVRHQLRLLLPVEEGRDGQLAQCVEGQGGRGFVRRGEEVGQLRQGVEHRLVVRVAQEAGEEAEDGPDGLDGRGGDRRGVGDRFGLLPSGRCGGGTAAAAAESRLGLLLTADQEERRVGIEQMVQGRVDGVQWLDPLVQVGLLITIIIICHRCDCGERIEYWAVSTCHATKTDRTVVYLSLAKIFGTIKPSFPTPRFTNYNLNSPAPGISTWDRGPARPPAWPPSRRR